MSLFRFNDLPQEIKILVAKDVASQYRTYTKLKELSLISSIFTKPAQAQLFRYLSFCNFDPIDKFLTCIHFNSSLGLLVKEVRYFGIAYDQNGQDRLMEILKRCPTVLKLVVSGIRSINLDLQTLTGAKDLRTLTLLQVRLVTINASFKNLKYLRLSGITFDDQFGSPDPSDFPSLVTLHILSNDRTHWTKLESLFPQIVNLSIYGHMSAGDNLENFTSLKTIELNMMKLTEIIDALSQIKSTLKAVRINGWSAEEEESWDVLDSLILEGRTHSVLKLELLHSTIPNVGIGVQTPDQQRLEALCQAPSGADFEMTLNERGIKFELFQITGNDGFLDWLDEIREDGLVL